MRQFGHNDVEIVVEKTAWSGFWKLKLFRLRHRRFAGGWSETLTRELHCRGEAVGVLLYDPTLDAIGMVEQFRIGAAFRAGSPWLLELVAGLVEEGETPAEVAVRETTEESACVIRELLPVAGYYSSPGGTDEYFHLFCARVDLGDAGGLHGKAGEHEDIRLHVIPYAEVAQLQRDGHFNNAHTLIALQWLAMHRDEVRRAWT